MYVRVRAISNHVLARATLRGWFLRRQNPLPRSLRDLETALLPMSDRRLTSGAQWTAVFSLARRVEARCQCQAFDSWKRFGRSQVAKQARLKRCVAYWAERKKRNITKVRRVEIRRLCNWVQVWDCLQVPPCLLI